MMMSLIQLLQHWIQSAGGLGVFAASIVEEIISLIPSSMVQTGAGVFLLGGQSVSLVTIIKLIVQISLPAALGVTLGSLPYVWLARKYGIMFVERYGKWVGVAVTDIKNLEQRLAKTAWDDIVFVLMRAFPVIPSVALAVYGGMVEMSWWRYSILSFVGVFIRATGLGIVGWFFGNRIDAVSSGVGLFENLGLLVAVFLIIGFLLARKSKKTTK
jgi:membrane protein DedA with SNARE-associated domain